jgi:hypothetical protein
MMISSVAACCGEEGAVLNESWNDWQYKVVAIIRQDYEDVLSDLENEDIDWDAWRPLYDEGRSPRAAVELALAKIGN